MYGFSGFPLTGVLETGVSDRPDKGLTRMRKPWLSIAKHDLLYERKAKIMFCKTPVCKTPVCKTRVCKRETFAKPLFVKQKLKWVTKSVSFSCQDPLNSPKASAFPQLSLSFPSAFPQLSLSFPSAFRVTRFHLPVSGPLSPRVTFTVSAWGFIGTPVRRQRASKVCGQSLY